MGCERIFDEIFRIPLSQMHKGFADEIPFRQADFDLVDLQYHQCGKLINASKQHWPLATVNFSPMESQLRACGILLTSNLLYLLGNVRTLCASVWHAAQELIHVKAADRVVTVSDSDRAAICHFKSKEQVFCIPTAVSRREFPKINAIASATQPVVVFFAYFGSKTNEEALLWYCQNVHPLVRSAVGSYRLRVVGRDLDPNLRSTCTLSGIDIVGTVETVQEALSGAAIGIAPALSGAGIRGKIHQYAMHGIPCVASSIACESLSYIHGESILVANDATSFADACISLLKDDQQRTALGRRAQQVCFTEYSWHSMADRIADAYLL